MPESKTIYVGIKGTVLALDAATGRPLWATKLKGSDFVNVVVEGEKILAATCGEVFCLDRKTGRVLWHNELKGYGRGLVSIATESSTKNNPGVLAGENTRRDAEATGAMAASSGAVAS